LGINRLTKLLAEDLSRAFTTTELRKFCEQIQRNIDLYSLTGYPTTGDVPRFDAATSLVDYFYKTNRLNTLLNTYMHASMYGFKGEKVVFSNIKQILQEMSESGYQYNRELNKFVIVEKKIKRTDWGFLEDGNFYDFCFVSVDICGNTKLVRKYDANLIQNTYLELMKSISEIILRRDGRIWVWEGDGGLLVFHLKDFVNQAIYSSIEILSTMPAFNATKNYIDDDLQIRIGINAGKTEYKKDNRTIQSDAIKEVKIIEKSYTSPMTISITPQTYQYIDSIIKRYLVKKTIQDKTIYQLKIPLLGENIGN
jgi:class 3 adenylate cyclase